MNLLLEYWTGTVAAGTKTISRHHSLNILLCAGTSVNPSNGFEFSFVAAPRKFTSAAYHRISVNQSIITIFSYLLNISSPPRLLKDMWLGNSFQKVNLFNTSDATNFCSMKYIYTQSISWYTYKYTTTRWWMVEFCSETTKQDMNGLVQDLRKCIASTLELLQSCLKTPIYHLL